MLLASPPCLERLRRLNFACSWVNLGVPSPLHFGCALAHPPLPERSMTSEGWVAEVGTCQRLHLSPHLPAATASVLRGQCLSISLQWRQQQVLLQTMARLEPAPRYEASSFLAEQTCLAKNPSQKDLLQSLDKEEVVLLPTPLFFWRTA